ncbi:MAG: transcription termination factor NusA [Verrucomicrobiales bacterium]
MNAEFIAMLEYLEREKGIKREVLLEAVAEALLTASKKAVGPTRELHIDIDPKTGAIRALAHLIVVEDSTENPQEEISLAKARRTQPTAQLGDEIEVEVTPQNLGRIAAQVAKQAIAQRLRKAEKELIFDEFKDRAGDIVTGTVRRFDRSDVIVDLGRFEAIMPNRERVQTEEYNIGDRVRAYVVAVENGVRGPEIILSRSHPNFVRRLFEVEVSEIADRTVELKSVAREAGYRTKIAVYSADEKVDPVGACVGMRGARVKNIVRELNNEKVDILRWSPDPREMLIEALKPVKPRHIEVDEAAHKIQVVLEEEDLSQAIGRRGQNARLTSRLLGWDISITKPASKEEVYQMQKNDAVVKLQSSFNLDADVCQRILEAGFSDPQILSLSEPEDIASKAMVDLELAKSIHDKALALTSSDGPSLGGSGSVAAPSETEDSSTEASASVESPTNATA